MKDIPGYEGLYAATEDGYICNLSTGRKTKGSLGKSGYYTTTLTKNHESKAFRVHRLIALTFIPNPENKPIVNHLDENKSNNNVSNLAWATAEENVNWGTAMVRAAKTHEKIREKKKMEQYGQDSKEKQVPVSSTLLPREKEKLQEIAKEKGVSVTVLIQTAIRNYYFNQEEQN